MKKIKNDKTKESTKIATGIISTIPPVMYVKDILEKTKYKQVEYLFLGTINNKPYPFLICAEEKYIDYLAKKYRARNQKLIRNFCS